MLLRAVHELKKNNNKIDNLFLAVSCYVADFQYIVAIRIIATAHETLLSQDTSTPIEAWQL